MLVALMAGLMALASPESGLRLVKQIEFPNAARPEIIAAGDRCYVIYLLPSPSGNTFNVKIFDKDLSREIADKTLVRPNTEYGHPTDIRVVSDGAFAYAFFETTDEVKTFLWAAKFELSDAFNEIAQRGPIATSSNFRVARPGDEKLDDPAPMVRASDLYVMTRFKSTFAIEGATRYRLRRFDLHLNPMGEIDLDLSDFADGEARQSSVLAQDGHYYLAMTTTTGTGTIPDVMWTFPSDVIVVELDENWKVIEQTVIAADPLYTETYVTGLDSDGQHFYVTYSRVILGQELSSVIAIFDRQWNRLGLDAYLTLTGPDATKGLRPSLALAPGRVYAGNDDAITRRALIYVFEREQPVRRRAVEH